MSVQHNAMYDTDDAFKDVHLSVLPPCSGVVQNSAHHKIWSLAAVRMCAL